MAHEKLRPSYFFDEERIKQLKQIAPECFEDGEINFDTLRENLGDFTQHEEDPDLEHFGLFWPGKRDARKAAALPPEGTLEPVWGDGLKADGTPDTDGTNDSKNVFIEGENLEVLKLLQKSYANKIKLIYIDPPYNTGNDFVYDDDFTEPLQEYLRRTGQVDEEGKAMTSNKRSDGRFHSKWLSMMYPRLRLARNLLREDGVIFIHIDDNEVANLKLIMNEIFGEENCISQICHKSRASISNDKIISTNHNHILLYSKNYEEVFAKRKMFGIEPDLDGFKMEDDIGKYKLVPVDGPGGATKGNPYYEFLGVEQYFRFSKERMQLMYEQGKIVKVGNGLQQKYYLEDARKTRKTDTTWWDDNYYNSTATSKLNKLMGGDYFSNPKSIELLKRVLSLWCRESGDIVLDFFAGSGSTAHAVLEYQTEINTRINFVSVQLPEKYDEKEPAFINGYKVISDTTKQRIRLVSKKIISEGKIDICDIGFKALSLKTSNYKPWKNYHGVSTTELENQLDLFNQNPLCEGYSEDGLLTEIMLIEGFTLCSSITSMAEITSNKIRKVSSEYCEHSLLVCLDAKLDVATISNLHLGEADIFICLDSAVSTQDKLRLSDKGLIKTI
jgi:adenine-specific DNA-methyltransferase